LPRTVGGSIQRLIGDSEKFGMAIAEPVHHPGAKRSAIS
jgi:hypothetical protein